MITKAKIGKILRQYLKREGALDTKRFSYLTALWTDEASNTTSDVIISADYHSASYLFQFHFINSCLEDLPNNLSIKDLTFKRIYDSNFNRWEVRYCTIGERFLDRL